MVGVNHKEAKKRLQEVIVDSKSKSLRAFALSINIDPSLLAKVIGDQRTLTPAMVKAITEKYNVNEDWLLYGEGEKYGQNGTTKPKQRPSDLLTGAHVTLQDYINKIEEHNVFLQYVIKNGLVSLESNLKTGQLQIQEQLFAVGESLGNQMEGVSLGLASLAKNREVAKKDKDISGKQGGGDGKDKSRT